MADLVVVGPPKKSGLRTFAKVAMIIAAIPVVAFVGLFIYVGVTMDWSKTPGTSAVSPAAKSVSATPPVTKPAPSLPAVQQSFIDIVERYRRQFRSADGDLRKAVTRTERGKELGVAIAATSGQIRGWIGTINELKTTEDGQAYISIAIGGDVTLMTANNRVTDIAYKTLVPQTSPVFKQMMDLKARDRVVFDATLWREAKDGWVEMSLSERGAMIDPIFLITLVSIRKAP